MGAVPQTSQSAVSPISKSAGRSSILRSLAKGTERRLEAVRHRRLGSLRYGSRRPHPHLTGTMQSADRRRLGGSRRGKSAGEIRTATFDSPFSEPISLRKMRASATFGRGEPPRRRRSYREPRETRRSDNGTDSAQSHPARRAPRTCLLAPAARLPTFAAQTTHAPRLRFPQHRR